MSTRRLPSLSALRAFEAAARHSSARLAADELSVTPTAISHQVRQLEDTLGLALFVRKPRQLVLTREGRDLMGVLGEAFDAIDRGVSRLRRRPERASVTLSTTPAVASRWLLPWVCALREAHPLLDLRVHVSHEAVDLDGVTADLAIRYGSGDWPGLEAEKLFDNVFIPTCSPTLALRQATDLLRVPLIHFDPPCSAPNPVSWSNWHKLAPVPGLDIAAGPVFSDETHAIAAALDGQGVALMSRALIADELRSGRLIQPFGPDLPGQPFHLTYPTAMRDDARIRAVCDWVRGLALPA